MNKIKTKNIFIVGLLAVAMLLSAILGLSAVKTQRVYADPEPLPALTYELSAEGVLTVNRLAGDYTSGYWYKLSLTISGVENDYGTGIEAENNSNPTYQFDLKNQLVRYHAISGIYTYELAVYDGEDATAEKVSQTVTGTYNYVSTQTPYAAPTNLHWDGKVARWEAGEELVAGAKYRVTLYDLATDARVGSPFYDVTTTYLSFSTLMEDGKEYYFTVQVVVNGDVQLDRAYSAIVSNKPVEAARTGLGAGAIVGIVLASVVVAGCGVFAVVWFVVKKKTWADFVAVFKKK